MASKDKIEINVVGESATGVTGSCVWVKTPDVEFLIECGLYQSSGSILSEYKVNNAPFKFKPKNISYVFACHNHGDHILRLPLLFKRGMDAPIYMPEGSTPIAQILMEDSARIMACDAADLSKQFDRNYLPIYEQNDVDTCVSHIHEVPMSKVITLDKYVKFKFIPSGHILNSAQIEITVTCGNISKTIAYTSDLGNLHIKNEFSNKFQPFKHANILIGETTYGGESRIATQKARNTDLKKLQSVIKETCQEAKGRVLIPCFANARSQEMLVHLYDLFGDDPFFKIPVLFDTPMGIRVCEAYKNLLSGSAKEHFEKAMAWENVKFILDASESRAWQKDNQPAVIISSSGMLTHGRSRAYVKEMLNKPNNVIAFCGYSVDNSLASIIKEGKVKTIKLAGKRVANRCRVVDLHSFSSHMQQDDLIKYYSNVDCEKILLVHGESENKQIFKDKLEEAISKNNKTSKIICTNKGYSITM